MGLYEERLIMTQLEELQNRVAVLETQARAAGLPPIGSVPIAPPIASTEPVNAAPNPGATAPEATDPTTGLTKADQDAAVTSSPGTDTPAANESPRPANESGGNTETVGQTQIGPAKSSS